jgi:hypothetical protein
MNNNSKKDLDDDVDVDVSPTDNAQPGKNADDSLAEEADVAAAAAEKAKNAYDKANAAADSAEKVYKEAKNAADKAENAADEAENAAAKKAYEEAARAWNASKRRFDAAKKAYDEAAGTAAKKKAKATKKEAVADTSTNEGTAAIGWWVFVPMVILMILIGLAIFPINKEFASGWGESGSKLVTVKLEKFVVTALAIAVISACLAVLTQSEYDVTTFCRFHLVPCLMLVLVGIQRFLDRTKPRLNPNAYE